MTETLDRIREAVKVLPEVEERHEGDSHVFCVADEPFVRVQGDEVAVRGGDGVTLEWITGAAITSDIGFPWSGDHIGRAWELAAPAALLEAGGR